MHSSIIFKESKTFYRGKNYSPSNKYVCEVFDAIVWKNLVRVVDK